MHYFDPGDPSASGAYCINPDGGLAYDLPISWVSGDTTNIQVTTNPIPCDVNANNKILPFVVSWLPQNYTPIQQQYDCQPSAKPTILSGSSIWALQTFCDFRIWIHEGDNGTGASHCIDPNPWVEPDQGYSPPNDREYWQVQQTNIQAPCAAGGPPYSV